MSTPAPIKRLITFDFGEYSNETIRVIERINKGKRVRRSTLTKHNLEKFLDNPAVSALVIEAKAKRVAPQNQLTPPSVSVEATNKVPRRQLKFEKKDVVEFIKNYYPDNKTKEGYLSRYDNNRQKKTITHLPDFTNEDLEDDQFWNDFINIKNIKKALSPLSTYLQSMFPGNFDELKKKVTGAIRDKIDDETANAIAKNTLPLAISADTMLNKWKEFKETGDLKIDTKYYSRVKGEKRKMRDMLDAIILGLYVTIPVRDDFGKVTFGTNGSNQKSGFNYIDFGKKHFMILPKKGKNNQTRYLKLPDFLLNMISDYVDTYDLEYLITKEKDLKTPVGDADKRVTKAMERIFEKKITINDIRKSFTTYVRAVGSDAIKEMANIQGHSLQVANTYYIREPAV